MSMDSDDPHVIYDLAEGVGTITLNRPNDKTAHEASGGNAATQRDAAALIWTATYTMLSASICAESPESVFILDNVTRKIAGFSGRSINKSAVLSIYTPQADS